MEGLKITRISMTDEACANVMSTAVEAGFHGIGYWASVRLAQRLDKMIVDMQVLDLEGVEEGEEPKRYRVSRAGIRKAVQRMLADPKGTDSAGWTSEILSRELDGPLADAIVQVACFGSVIYG